MDGVRRELRRYHALRHRRARLGDGRLRAAHGLGAGGARRHVPGGLQPAGPALRRAQAGVAARLAAARRGAAVGGGAAAAGRARGGRALPALRHGPRALRRHLVRLEARLAARHRRHARRQRGLAARLELSAGGAARVAADRRRAAAPRRAAAVPPPLLLGRGGRRRRRRRGGRRRVAQGAGRPGVVAALRRRRRARLFRGRAGVGPDVQHGPELRGRLRAVAAGHARHDVPQRRARAALHRRAAAAHAHRDARAAHQRLLPAAQDLRVVPRAAAGGGAALPAQPAQAVHLRHQPQGHRPARGVRRCSSTTSTRTTRRWTASAARARATR